MKNEELEVLIAKCLHVFYDRRMKRIQELKLRDVLKRKNPYLFRATGIEKYSEIVEDILRAFISSSDETMFGDAFFEPMAKLSSTGTIAPSEGIDIAIETDKRYTAIAMKSGTDWGDKDQLKKQNENFVALRSRVYKNGLMFDPVIGHGYGRKKGTPKGKIYRNISGQAFWTEITGDVDFYLKLIRLMNDEPQKHRSDYKTAWDRALNRFNGEFYNEFCFHDTANDGAINWEKLAQLVSEDKDLKAVSEGQTQLSHES
jgi:hypothetical protein